MAQEYDLGSVVGPEGPTGATGATGPTGATGATPNITVGTVTTLAAGATPTVSRRSESTDEAPVFDFGFPAGAGGDMEASVYDPSNMHQDVFAYVDAHAGRRGATLVVAANNSKDKTKADYVCDGVADQYTIQQAINALPSTGGCIQLLDGTYLLDKTGITPAAGTYYLATMSIDNIAIRGLGDATILKLANSAGESGEKIALLGFMNNGGFQLSDLVIDGNKNANSGVDITGLYMQGGNDMHMCNVTIKNCSLYGANIWSDKAIIHACRFNANATGLYESGYEADIFGNRFYANATALHLYIGRYKVFGNHINNSTTRAIYYTNGNKGVICNNTICTQPIGMLINATNDVMIYGNLIARTIVSNTYAAGEEAISLTSCNRVYVTNNWMRGKAVSADGNCSDVMLAWSGTDWNVTA